MSLEIRLKYKWSILNLSLVKIKDEKYFEEK